MANNLFIDNVAISPAHTQVFEIPRDLVDYPGPAGGRQSVVDKTPPDIEMLFGIGGVSNTIVNTLRQLFIDRIDHVLSWKDEGDTRFKYRNVLMPPVGYSQRPGLRYVGGAVDSFTMRFRQHTPSPTLVVVELLAHVKGGSLTTGDGKAKYKAPAGGFLYAVDGHIINLGTGAGQTEVQLSVGAKDYFSTTGKFVVASGTNLMEAAVLATLSGGGLDTDFDRGAVFELDVDAIPGGANSNSARVRLALMMWRV